MPKLATSSTTSDRGTLTIQEAAQAFLAANPKYDQVVANSRRTEKTRTQFKAAIFLAAKFFGPDTPIAKIDETAVAELFPRASQPADEPL